MHPAQKAAMEKNIDRIGDVLLHLALAVDCAKNQKGEALRVALAQI